MLSAGEGFVDLPLVDTRVVNLSLDHDGICQSLLQQILAVERPEFQRQKLNLNRDAVHLLKKIEHEKVWRFVRSVLLVENIAICCVFY